MGTWEAQRNLAAAYFPVRTCTTNLQSLIVRSTTSAWGRRDRNLFTRQNARLFPTRARRSGQEVCLASQCLGT